MGKSRKKTPIVGFSSAKSNKNDKRLANRKLRRVVKSSLLVENDIDELPLLRETSNVYSFEKDGKQYLKNFNDKDLRK